MLSPRSLNLPYDNFFPHQLEALERIKQTDKRFVILQAPTGTGKTLIAAATQKITGMATSYCVMTRQLQTQAARDFSHAKVLWGRKHYETLLDSSKTAEDCQSEPGDPGCRYCPSINSCPYRVASREANAAPFAILNLHTWLSHTEHTGMFRDREWVILDEADQIESVLMDWVSVGVGKYWVNKWSLREPKITVIDDWKEWAKDEVLPRVTHEIRRSQGRMLRRLSDLRVRLEHFLQVADQETWVYDKYQVALKPVYLQDYARKLLWDKAKRFVLMSATVLSLDQFCWDLGIDQSEVEFVDLPSTFPPGRRPIYYQPAAEVIQKNKGFAYGEVTRAIDKICTKHHNQKILIHTVNYELSDFITTNSAHRGRMLTYRNAGERQGVLDNFREANDNRVLVASSMERGVDLPHDACRVVIVAKIPWPNKGDIQVAARLYRGRTATHKRRAQNWYVMQAIRSLVQSTGRGMRAKDDYCWSYILDAGFGKLIKNYRQAFPAWWREALK